MAIRFNDPVQKPTVKKSGVSRSEKIEMARDALERKDAPVVMHEKPVRKKSGRKEQIALRLDPDVLEWFRSTGYGWQVRMQDVLRRHVEEAGSRPVDFGDKPSQS